MNLKLLTAAILVVVTSSPAKAGDFERYTQALGVLGESDPRPSVASVASGFGAKQGQFFAAVSYSDRDLQTDDPDDDDGSIVLGLGFGDPLELGAIEVSVGITSVSTAWWGDGKFADEGNLNIKLHKSVAPILGGEYASASVGASNLTGWGGTREMPTNTYAAYSEHRSIGEFGAYKLAYTFGYGSSAGLGEAGGSFFGGAALARSNFNTSLSMNEDEVNVSAGMYLPSMPELMFTVTRADAFNSAGYRRNIFTLGYSQTIGVLR